MHIPSSIASEVSSRRRPLLSMPGMSDGWIVKGEEEEETEAERVGGMTRLY